LFEPSSAFGDHTAAAEAFPFLLAFAGFSGFLSVLLFEQGAAGWAEFGNVCDHALRDTWYVGNFSTAVFESIVPARASLLRCAGRQRRVGGKEEHKSSDNARPRLGGHSGGDNASNRTDLRNLCHLIVAFQVPCGRSTQQSLFALARSTLFTPSVPSVYG
jgi:hypothetical protein